MEFLMWSLYGRAGIPIPKSPLRALHGEAACAALVGNRKLLYLETMDAKSGNWRHAASARGGYSKVAIGTGMGLATNVPFLSCPVQVLPLCIAIWDYVYDQPSKIIIERARIKAPVSKMPEHVDICLQKL